MRQLSEFLQSQLPESAGLVHHFFEAVDGKLSLRNGLNVSECRDKALKDTISWSSNLLISIHFHLKKTGLQEADESPAKFAQSLKERLESQFAELRVETNGYLVILDKTKVIQQLPNPKFKPKHPTHVP